MTLPATLNRHATVITQHGCPHCEHAIVVLDHHNVSYSVVELDRDIPKLAYKAIHPTAQFVPVIWYAGEAYSSSEFVHKLTNTDIASR